MIKAKPSKKDKTRREEGLRGTVAPRGDNKWLVRYYVGLNAEGRRIYRSEVFIGTKTKAEDHLREQLHKEKSGVVTQPSKKLLKDFLDEWLRDVATPSVTPVTLTGYEAVLRWVQRDKLGQTSLGKVRAEDIQKFYATLSPSSARHLHSPLRQALGVAVKWKLINVNPCQDVILPKHRSQEIEVLTGPEARRLMEVRKFVRKEVVKGKSYEGEFENRYRPLFNFLLVTGARPSEAFGLRWSDVDFVRGHVSIQRTLHWNTKAKGGGWYFSKTKTRSSQRKLPLPANLLRLLKEHRATQSAMLLELGVRSDLMFCTSEGTPITRRNLVKRHFKPVLEAAGLPQEFTLYGLRHTCASLLLQANVSPKVAAEFLGHSSTKMFLDIYGHLLPGMREIATVELDRILYAPTAANG